MLANLYMNRFLKYWRLQEKGQQYQAKIVAYADDFVILSRGYAEQARDRTQAVMSRIGLTLNEQKTSIRDAPHFLRCRHKATSSKGSLQFPITAVFGSLGFTGCGRPLADQRVRRMKSVGKPDAGDRHVRFDERGRETGRRHRAFPRLYPV